MWGDAVTWDWKSNWHRFSDHLVEEKGASEFFEHLS